MSSFIHDRMRFYFVHVPKTGGTSVTHFFFVRDREKYREMRAGFSLKNSKIGIHDGIDKINAALGDESDSYFSFAFYRNTWDWCFSYYRYMKATKSHPMYDRVSKISFEEYVDNVAEEYYRPQRQLVADETGSRVKRLEDFSRFSEAFSEITWELGYPRAPVPVSNANKVKSDYRTAYTTAMMKKVGDIYEEDIEFFGFRF